MKLSDEGLEFLARQEGCRLYAYTLGDGMITIGYGHAEPINTSKYKRGDKISKQQALDLFRSDIEKWEEYVNKYVTNIELKQSGFDALVSYTYNRGLGKSNGSNGLRQLVKHSSSVEEYYHNIPIYWGSALKFERALKARRRREAELFIKDYKNNDFNYPVLKIKAKGEYVRLLQTKLNEKGVNHLIVNGKNKKLAVDGIFGVITKAGVQLFQIKNNLLIDGIVGKQTWGKLMEE